MIEIIAKLKGFEKNNRCDAWDHGKSALRIYTDDRDLIIVKFNNMKNQSIVWRSTLSMDMGADLVAEIIRKIIAKK